MMHDQVEQGLPWSPMTTLINNEAGFARPSFTFRVTARQTIPAMAGPPFATDDWRHTDDSSELASVRSRVPKQTNR
jgi:hypothetical protein